VINTMSKKTISILVIVIVIIIGGFIAWRDVGAPTGNTIVGGDRDAHGCIPSAGYSWCEAKNSCIRTWETYCTAATGKTVTFFCDASKEIVATFYPTDDKFVDLVLSDGRAFSIPHAVSANGARYANADETFVFWNVGDTAFVTEGASSTETFSDCVIKKATDEKNATYIINGKPVTLENGVSEVPAAPGSASKIATRYFGNEIREDLNGDGREDTAFLLTQETGGSGTFYYAVAALDTTDGYVGSHGFFLGDRIAPQATVKGEGGIIIFNYADRAPDEPFSARPSIGVSARLQFNPGMLQFDKRE